ncbi:Cathepsin_B [Hexamita inflata]|uniref:Cathepsin B n=1 Tax=Hexamita inflata TaxID=28002 RepID=A0AA86UMG8_9EUKA|nr:Cathepsin B [Hexamita inflata]
MQQIIYSLSSILSSLETNKNLLWYPISMKRTYEIPNPIIDWSTQNLQCVSQPQKLDVISDVSVITQMLSEILCILQLDESKIEYSAYYIQTCATSPDFFKALYFLKRTGTTTNQCVETKQLPGVCPTKCDNNEEIPKLFKINNYKNVKNETSMEQEILNAPLLSYMAIFDDLQFYGGGIYQHEYGQMTGYKGVEIVGFGEDDGNKYWKVKLDKGTEWGEEGYLRIIKGIDDCFIESNAYTISIPE